MIKTDGQLANIVSLIIIILALAFGIFCVFSTLKNKKAIIPLGVLSTLTLVSFIFDWNPAFIICAIFSGIYICICLVLNAENIRKFFRHPIKGLNYKEQVQGVEKIFDVDQLYDVINKAVVSFSNSKTGALITFERNDSLDKYIAANGVRVDAPVTVEMLQTIFYEGTRLHDGGLIIKDDMIEAAAVAYPLDDGFYVKKYGMRHRAAMGMSKATDSITVVVSEETGRISIAVKGELNTVNQENFRTVFENYMSEEDDDD